MVREQLGKEIYLPFIYSLFFFILISNLIGNIPYSYTITTSVIVTIGLSFTILTGVTILGLYIHRLHFLLKILSTFLYQMFSSSFIIAIFTLIPFAFFLALCGLEVAVSIIQAYVFVLLVISYIKDAIYLH